MSDLSYGSREFKGLLSDKVRQQLEDENEVISLDSVVPKGSVFLRTIFNGNFPPKAHQRHLHKAHSQEFVASKSVALRHVQLVEDQLALATVLARQGQLAWAIPEFKGYEAFEIASSPSLVLGEGNTLFFELRDGVARKEPQLEERRPTDFEPSVLLTALLVKDFGALPVEAQREAVSRLKGVVLGMLQSVADAHAFARKTEPYRISTGPRFVRAISKAVQERLELDPYEAGRFLYQLHRELETVCPLKVSDWSLECGSDRSLFVSPAPRPAAVKPRRERAHVVRMKFAQRAAPDE